MEITNPLSPFGMFLVLTLLGNSALAEAPEISLDHESGHIQVKFNGTQIATYVFSDVQIPRPYFAHIRTPGGIQVTRNHPPVEGEDSTDHATYHPGIWMAFGDLSGADNWRNKAKVVSKRIVSESVDYPEPASFVVRNTYFSEDERAPLCEEIGRYTFIPRPSAYLLVWDSTFSAAQEPFYFGDQEEMGLGVRVATPITEQSGGKILTSYGLKGARQSWGRTADWCSYSGNIRGTEVGVTLMCSPKNFRPSWFHVRDYGLLLANAFGREAFKAGGPSQVVIEPGEKMRLRYGILVHEGQVDLSSAYLDFVGFSGN